MKPKYILLSFSLVAGFTYLPNVMAVEYGVHGIADLRLNAVDSLEKSYLAAGQGKFGLNNGAHASIAQAATQLSATWDNGLSLHSVINAYANTESNNDSKIGMTETYLKYRTIPNQAGYRFQIKSGIYYPEISLENDAFAWASKDTLNSSMINTWIGEEVRVLGTDFKATRLGRLNNNKFDLSFSASAFVNNDPTGALLAWHGWTSSSRQTLWTERRTIPWFDALDEGGVLENQARDTDPFLELDNNIGYHLNVEWKLHHQGEISAGYYDNRATPYKVVNGQYGWDTRFYHLGAKWRLSQNISLVAQYLAGETLMQNTSREDVVNNSYQSGFIALSYRWFSLLGNKKHKSTVRVEEFSVDDHDNTVGDDNNEDGIALTLNHTYRVNKNWFVAAEANVIDSTRPARAYENQDIDLVEKQLQLSVRYFF
ncbi:hypothetical protein [Psychromonas algicola]|uniref:hypothetical protein n=1 Tax=Psychromonas algicola TaxID=2555642 RepID=UPI001FBAE94C|nr:hypothetical protein [Psychromonas sp. RZ5]